MSGVGLFVGHQFRYDQKASAHPDVGLLHTVMFPVLLLVIFARSSAARLWTSAAATRDRTDYDPAIIPSRSSPCDDAVLCRCLWYRPRGRLRLKRGRAPRCRLGVSSPAGRQTRSSPLL